MRSISSGFGFPFNNHHFKKNRIRSSSNSNEFEVHGTSRKFEASKVWTLKESLASCCILTASDFLAQKIELWKVYDVLEKQQLSTTSRHHFLCKNDNWRSARMAAYGFVIYGPLVGLWYRLMESTFKRSSPLTTITKVTLSQTTVNPSLLALTFVYNYVLTGRSSEIPEKFRKDYISTLTNVYKFWIPTSTVNFSLVPLQHRVAFSSFCSLIWNCYVSMRSH